MFAVEFVARSSGLMATHARSVWGGFLGKQLQMHTDTHTPFIRSILDQLLQ